MKSMSRKSPQSAVRTAGYGRHAFLVGAVVLVCLIALRPRGGGNELQARFGEPLRAEVLTSLDPEQRLHRIQMELERRVAVAGGVLRHLSPAALPLLVIHRQEETIRRRGFSTRGSTNRADLEHLAEAYLTVGLTKPAAALRQNLTSDRESPAQLERRWYQSYHPDESTAAQIAYADRNLGQILDHP